MEKLSAHGSDPVIGEGICPRRPEGRDGEDLTGHLVGADVDATDLNLAELKPPGFAMEADPLRQGHRTDPPGQQFSMIDSCPA
jgi:hypothetical protein